MIMNNYSYATLRVDKTEESKELERKAELEMSAIRRYKKARIGNIFLVDICAMLIAFLFFNLEPVIENGVLMCTALAAANLIIWMTATRKFEKTVKKHNLEITDGLQSVSEKRFSEHLNRLIEKEIMQEKLQDCVALRHSLIIEENHYDILIKYKN